MPDIKTVMSWVEGLTQDDWRLYYSDSEVQETAKAALALLKEQEPIAPIIEQDMNEYTSCIEEVYFCGACQDKVYRSEKYCANCGRKIKWND